MFKKSICLILCILAVWGLAGCSLQTAVRDEGKIKVLVTFNALKEFAQAVGKDKVDVTVIIPDGTEPHDFEPKAKDLEGLSTCDVFVYNGLGMEAWAEEAVKAANNGKLIVKAASDGIDPVTNTNEEEIQEHGQYDPHTWLSLKGAEAEACNIRDALSKASPADKEYFEKNCDAYTAQLESLYSDYHEKFAAAKNKSFVTGHAAFAYLCRDFGLQQNSVEDVFAEGEPSAQKLTELVEYCKENNVKTIFAEETASAEVSQTLANEVGASVETIYTIEKAEDGLTYMERMKDNLEKILNSLS